MKSKSLFIFSILVFSTACAAERIYWVENRHKPEKGGVIQYQITRSQKKTAERRLKALAYAEQWCGGPIEIIADKMAQDKRFVANQHQAYEVNRYFVNINFTCGSQT